MTREALDRMQNELVTISLGRVEPLDEQFGMVPKQNVPAALQGPLFEEADYSSGPSTDQPQSARSYVIIDASKAFGVVDIIEGSGLPYRCLFKGVAATQRRDHAPYIVALDPLHSFTRRLFTCSAEPWHFWEKELGIFVRFHGTIDDAAFHFRKFTKIRNDAGKWFYFRFWDSACLEDFLRAHLPNGSLAFFDRVHSVVTLTTKEARILYKRTITGTRPFARLVVSTDSLRRYEERRHDASMRLIADHIGTAGVLADRPTDDLMQVIAPYYQKSQAYGFLDGREKYIFILGHLLVCGDLEKSAQFDRLLTDPLKPESERRENGLRWLEQEIQHRCVSHAGRPALRCRTGGSIGVD